MHLTDQDRGGVVGLQVVICQQSQKFCCKQSHRPTAKQSSQWPGNGMQASCNVAGRPACQQQRPCTHYTATAHASCVTRAEHVVHLYQAKFNPRYAVINPANPRYAVVNPAYHAMLSIDPLWECTQCKQTTPSREYRPSLGAVTITLHDSRSWLHNKQGWQGHVCTHTQTCMPAHIGSSEPQQLIELHGAGRYCRGTALSVLMRTGR